MIPWLRPQDPFPSLDEALEEPNGLLAAGGKLSAERLLEAYRQGIFPWFNQGDPVLWWSPDPRMVLMPPELKTSRSLRKRLQRGDYEIRVDSAFREMMEGCAEPRRGQMGTWIHPAMIRAYTALHQAGFAHSVETWIEGKLAGGLYGVALGRVFFGESMFSRAADASKIALVHLVRQLERWRFGIIDCQMNTPHLASMGAREISRHEFSLKLLELVNYPGTVGRWQFDYDLLE